MRKRTFIEMVEYINDEVSKMDISIEYKLKIAGMLGALTSSHEETKWHCPYADKEEVE